MPELPDVEVLRRHLLAQHLTGQRIVGLDLRWPKAVRTPSPDAFAASLPGQRIRELGRRAKYLLFRLESGSTLIVHLRMTGLLVIAQGDRPYDAFVRNAFALEDGRSLWFVDPRKLGQLWLVEHEDEVVSGLGPEPLSPDLAPHPDFTLDWLAQRLQGRRQPIKALLLEQAFIAGIGNIYADEVLFAAGVHPAPQARDLTSDQVAALHRVIPRVLAEAVHNLLPIVLEVYGPPTESSRGLTLLHVPRQEGAPCHTCGTPVRRLVLRGRSAYFCPSCQGEGGATSVP